MEPRSRNQRRSTSSSGHDDWRNRSNLMSISELFSKLRETFKQSDFSLVEKTLIAREEMLKAEIEDKKRELELSAERMKFEKLERATVEYKLEQIQEEIKKKTLKKNGNERGDAVPVKNRVVGDADCVARTDAEIAAENVRVFVKEMVGELEKNVQSLGRIKYEIEVKTVEGVDGNGKVVTAGDDGKLLTKKRKFVGEPSKKDCLGASDNLRQNSSGAVQKNLDTRLANPIAIPHDDAMRKANSSGAVQKSLDTRLAKPIAIPPDDAMRKAAIAEKIWLLQKKNRFKSPGRLNFDGEGETVVGESCGEKLVKVEENEDGKVVKAKLGNERVKLEVLKTSGVGDGEASAVAKLKDQKFEVLASAVAKLKDQKLEVLAGKKRLAGEPSKKEDLGSSGKMQKNSSGAVQENLATKLVESIGVKRDRANLDILNDLDDSSSSSSGSSSDEFDMDNIPPLMSLSNKKMRTNASQSTNELFTKLNLNKGK